MVKSKNGFKNSDFKQTDLLVEKLENKEVVKMNDEDKSAFMVNFSKTLLGELGEAVSNYAKSKEKSKITKTAKPKKNK